jgi:hypothetical protein
MSMPEIRNIAFRANPYASENTRRSKPCAPRKWIDAQPYQQENFNASFNMTIIVMFIMDPARSAIILCGGDKQGMSHAAVLQDPDPQGRYPLFSLAEGHPQ